MLGISKYIKSELINLTQDLIQIPSFTGDEGEIARYILEYLKRANIDDCFIDEIGNVVGIVRGNERGPNILLNGHLDIVPPGILKNWGRYDPFGAEIDKEGNIHGRGASDLKGGLSVLIFLVKVLQKLKNKNHQLPGNIIFSAVVHEEAAEMFGMEYLCTKTLPQRDINFDIVLLCEPTNLNVVLGHRGKVELEVKTKGRTAHSSSPWAGINALHKMMSILDAVFNKMAPNLRSDDKLGKDSVTVTNIICKPGALSIIPDECEISIDRRYGPGETLDDIINEFNQLFKTIKKKDKDFNATINVRKVVEKSYTGYTKEVAKHHPVWITNESNPFVNKMLNALKKVGQDAKVDYLIGGTDGSMTAGIMKIPTIIYSGMDFNYAHTPRDMVNISKIIDSFEGYLSTICEYFETNIDIVDKDLIKVFQ